MTSNRAKNGFSAIWERSAHNATLNYYKPRRSDYKAIGQKAKKCAYRVCNDREENFEEIEVISSSKFQIVAELGAI